MTVHATLSEFSSNFAVAGVCAVVGRVVTRPFEYVKLVLQTQDDNPKVKSGEIKRFSGTADCFKRTFRERGLRAFWRHSFSWGYVAQTAFSFALKDFIKTLFPQRSPHKEFFQFSLINIISGGIAGVVPLIFVYPLDYAQLQLVADSSSKKRTFNGLGDCMRKTAQGPNGVLGLYKGFGLSAAGIMAYRGVYFGLFDSLAAINPVRLNHDVTNLLSTFVIAQLSVAIAICASFPFDTVRRRLQMQVVTGSGHHSKSAFDCFSKIWKEGGVAALFKGVEKNAFRIGPALMLVAYNKLTSKPTVQNL
jgi:solute carrier family 25 (adenine nucleotide translocator) protein 4/5/6/31